MFGFIKEKFKSIKETIQFFKELDKSECYGGDMCQLSAEELSKIGTASEILVKSMEEYKNTESDSHILDVLNNIHSGYVVEPVVIKTERTKQNG